ncbi:hypothetical protein B0J11DRAFT_59206 [Dendryphion nanum]|uniref:Uncharacterized protein n=1 Tax=Dendryphion nanum TaxID=256645 RepID=A0A9P9DLN9_9PLEO|nr:hypothetical protein B0J11DRAFT_59206 [Dendryphion nanum]
MTRYESVSNDDSRPDPSIPKIQKSSNRVSISIDGNDASRLDSEQQSTPYEQVPHDEHASATHNDKKRPWTGVREIEDDQQQRKRFTNRISELCVHPILLVSLTVFFAVVSLTVGLLYHFSEAHQGLTAEEQSHRFAWIYGPTAALVLIQVVWRAIDLKIKETMPWHELVHGPSSADKTLLLEYISAMMPKNIWRSFKNKHWAVTMTIVGHLILLLMTVFATGLFALEWTTITETDIALQSSHFNRSAFNETSLTAEPAVLSLITKMQALSYPRGTTPDTVIPIFEPLVDSHIYRFSDAHYQAIVKGLHVSMDCETLDLKNATGVALPWWDDIVGFFANITTPSCNIINPFFGVNRDRRVPWTINATQNYQSVIKRYACNSGIDYMQDGGQGTLIQDKLDHTFDHRFLVAVTDLHFIRPRNGFQPPMWVNNLTALLCRPSYSINEYRVDYSKDSNVTQVELLQTTKDTLPDFSPGDIALALDTTINDLNALRFGPGGVDALWSVVHPFFLMLEMIIGGARNDFSLKDLIDPGVLKSSTESLLAGIMTQVFHQQIRQIPPPGEESTLTGTATYREERLHVKPLSTGILSAGFAIMSLLCVGLLFTTPRKIQVKGDIGSALTVANALRSNPELIKVFADSNPKSLKESMRSWSFVSHPEPDSGRLYLRSVDSFERNGSPSQHVPPSNHEDLQSAHWWSFHSTRSWFAIVAVLVCLIVIALLETLQQLSDSRNGFMKLNSMQANSAILALYIPAAVAVGITLMFGSIELVVATFMPFARLRKGNATGRTLKLNYITKSGPHMFLSSLINRDLALSVVLVTTFVASFLTIVIPGLYSKSTVPSTKNVLMATVDKFNPVGIDIKQNDNQAGVLWNMQTYHDTGYPDWIYNDLAFPKLRMDHAESITLGDTNSTGSSINVRTTALRARLQCERFPGHLRTGAVTDPRGGYNHFDWVNFQFNTYLPHSMCSNAPANASTNGLSEWRPAFWFDDSKPVRGSYNLGKAYILDWRTGGTDWFGGPNKFQLAGKLTEMLQYRIEEWGCPNLAFILGNVSIEAIPNNSSVLNSRAPINTTVWAQNNFTRYSVEHEIDIMLCSQNLQSVEVDLVLDYPSLVIKEGSPPRPDENTVQWLKNPADAKGGTGFQFGVRSMQQSLMNPNGTLVGGPWNKTDDVDSFMEAAIHLAEKEDGLSVGDIRGRENTAIFQKAMQKLYGRYMAHAISNNMRVEVQVDVPSIAVGKHAWTPTIPMPSIPSTFVPLSPTSASVRASNATAITRRSSSIRSPATQTPTLLIATRPSSSIPFATPSTFASESTLATETLSSPTLEANSFRPRSDNSNPRIFATLTHTDAEAGAQIRLVQNFAPKVALQVMLGIMAIGIVISRLLLRTEKMLQCEPYSIAGRAMLVANGDILSSSIEDDTKGLMDDGRKYRLRMWQDGDGRWRYGICEDK